VIMAGSRNDPTRLFNSALAAFRAGNGPQAAKLARRLSKAAANDPATWELRAMIASASGGYQDAMKFWKRATNLAPHSISALNNLGGSYRQLGKHDAAVECYEKSLSIEPGQPDTFFNLGAAHIARDDVQAGREAYEKGLELRPNDRDMRLNLSSALMKLGELEGALSEYRQLIELGFDAPEVRHGVFLCLARMGRLNEAETEFQILQNMGADDPQHDVDGSILFLMKSQWERGWRAYARRWDANPGSRRPFTQPWWTGQNLTVGKLLVWGDQGLGDEVMYASMLNDLRLKVSQIILEVDPRNVDLFQRSFPDIQCLSRTGLSNDKMAACDMQIPLSDLAVYLRKTDSDFGLADPYLVPDPHRVATLREDYLDRVSDGTDIKLVGITWRSLNARIGHDKSIPLQDLRSVLSMPKAAFVDLQYGNVADERLAVESNCGVTIHKDNLIDPTKDIDAHAAQIAAMDLVITVSNTTAHLAGAMGVPTWVMIQNIPDRRWLIDREDSPWYGSIRLFRQQLQGDWSQPIAEVTKEFAVIVGGQSD